jgi:hypothetical protein
MDMTPLPLADVLELLFGPDWRSRASVVFRRSRRQIGRWCSGETPLPSWAVRRIERLALEAGADRESWTRAKFREVEDQARERLALAQNTVTECRVRLIRRERNPPRGPGRPRKRPRGGPPPNHPGSRSRHFARAAVATHSLDTDAPSMSPCVLNRARRREARSPWYGLDAHSRPLCCW